jgi:hypothetical protein
MSLDTELFSSRPIPLEELWQSLPSQSRWRRYDGDTLAYEADRWQLVVGETETVGRQDVPADLRELLPAAGYRIGFVLEPVGAPDEALAFMAAAIAAVGRRFGCVGYDPYTGGLVAYARLPSR